MTVYRNEGQYDHSNVEYDGGRILTMTTQRDSGMRHIDYGLAFLTAGVFGAIPPGAVYDLARVYQDLLSAGNPGGFRSERAVL